MKKATRPGQPGRAPSSKFVPGVIAGSIIGTIAVIANPRLAVNILIGLVIVAAYAFFMTHQRNNSAKWSPRAFSPAPVVGALVVGVISVAGLQFLGMSLAWHPDGTIRKTVQNLTANSQAVDANTAATALAVQPGDILSYTVIVGNVAPPANNQYNDMAYTVMTDTLPAGVQLVADPAKRTITENLGTIKPGKSVTMVYQVKVISSTVGALIENKACFKADSVVRDNPQKGCDLAITKTKASSTPPPAPNPPAPTPTPPAPNPTPPAPTPTPTPPSPTPTPPATPPTPTPPTPPATPPATTTPPAPTAPPATPAAELPNVGPRSLLVVALFAALMGYLFTALYGYLNSNKTKRFGF